MHELLEPVHFELENEKGQIKKYILSKFPAVEGREIVTQYVASGLPKIGDYTKNEEIMFKLMSYVGITHGNGGIVRLTTRELVNSNVTYWEDLTRIEVAMMEYNCSFFRNGRISTFFEGLAEKLPMWIIKILTAFSAHLSPKTNTP